MPLAAWVGQINELALILSLKAVADCITAIRLIVGSYIKHMSVQYIACWAPTATKFA